MIIFLKFFVLICFCSFHLHANTKEDEPPCKKLCVTTALASKYLQFKILNEDVTQKILRYLNPYDLGRLSSLNTLYRASLQNNPGSLGERLRKQSKFCVICHDTSFFLEECLYSQRECEVSRIQNLYELAALAPNTYFQCVLKLTPKGSLKFSKTGQYAFFELFQAKQFRKDLRNGSSHQETYAYFMMEHLIWDILIDYTIELISEKVEKNTRSEFFMIQDYVIRNLVVEQCSIPILSSHNMDHFKRHYEGLKHHWYSKMASFLDDQIKHNNKNNILLALDHFPCKSLDDSSDVTSILSPSVQYVFMIFQLLLNSVRASSGFEDVFFGNHEGEGLLKFIATDVDSSEMTTGLHELSTFFSTNRQDIEESWFLLKFHMNFCNKLLTNE